MRRGFSFVEVLATLAIVALLASVVGANVMDRVRDGDFTKFSENAGTVKQASLTFLTDVGAYPGRPTQLVVQPVGGTAKDLFNSTISVGKAAKWRGPYVDVDSNRFFLSPGLGAVVVDSFTVRTSNGNQFMTAIYTGLSRTDQLRFKKDYDGGSGVAGPDSLTGMVRYTKDSLFLLITPAR